MMSGFDAKLLAQINKVVNKALKDTVAKEARNTLKEHIVEDVYEAYEPVEYQRTGGILQDENIETQAIGDTLTIRSIRHEGDRDISEVIEYGRGYDYEGLDEKIGARPFHQKTYEELKKGRAKKAMAEGLRKQGINVK